MTSSLFSKNLILGSGATTKGAIVFLENKSGKIGWSNNIYVDDDSGVLYGINSIPGLTTVGNGDVSGFYNSHFAINGLDLEIGDGDGILSVPVSGFYNSHFAINGGNLEIGDGNGILSVAVSSLQSSKAKYGKANYAVKKYSSSGSTVEFDSTLFTSGDFSSTLTEITVNKSGNYELEYDATLLSETSQLFAKLIKSSSFQLERPPVQIIYCNGNVITLQDDDTLGADPGTLKIFDANTFTLHFDQPVHQTNDEQFGRSLSEFGSQQSIFVAYVNPATGNTFLQYIDVTNPAVPAGLPRFQTNTLPSLILSLVRMTATTIAAVMEQEVAIFNVSNPASITLVLRTTFPGSQLSTGAFSAAQNRLYVCGDLNVIYVFDGTSGAQLAPIPIIGTIRRNMLVDNGRNLIFCQQVSGAIGNLQSYSLPSFTLVDELRLNSTIPVVMELSSVTLYVAQFNIFEDPLLKIYDTTSGIFNRKAPLTLQKHPGAFILYNNSFYFSEVEPVSPTNQTSWNLTRYEANSLGDISHVEIQLNSGSGFQTVQNSIQRFPFVLGYTSTTKKIVLSIVTGNIIRMLIRGANTNLTLADVTIKITEV